MNSLFRNLSLVALLALATTAFAQEAAAAAPAAPALEQRVADLEAYIHNTSPKVGDAAVASGPIAAVAGPGHNAFLMVCAALVLFMTLPGLFLFYGGLVRAKNVLSVAAQCLGIAG